MTQQRLTDLDGVTVAIHSAMVPLAAPEARRADALRWGDDYQLLLAAPEGIAPPVPLYPVGRILPRGASPLVLDGAAMTDPAGLGYQHAGRP